MADDAAFDSMETALRETARGRWFLDEWSRRVRHGETAMLLQALERIERSVVTLADRPAGQDGATSPVLPDIDATLPILEATERVQEIAWELREQGLASEVCDRLDRAASDIYAACAGHPPSEEPRSGPPTAAEQPDTLRTDEAGEPQPASPAETGDAAPDGSRPAPTGLAIADLARIRSPDARPTGPGIPLPLAGRG